MRDLISLVICWTMITLGCQKNDTTPPSIPSPPGKATLVLPAQNEACVSGTVLTATESSMLFQWDSAQNADSYELHIRNLETGDTQTRSSVSIQTSVTLSRGTPYSWYVVSKSARSTVTTKSDTWKFYNAGQGQVSYAPYPAEIVAPQMRQTVIASGGKIALAWNVSDADNDWVDCDVYLGTSSTPALLQAHIRDSKLSDVSVTSATTYYWKVVSRDAKGNTSASELYQFSVQ